jgi:hypothetical protein
MTAVAPLASWVRRFSMDGVMKPGQKPYNKQREKDSMLDGMSKVGCQHNENKNLEGSLSRVAKHLDRQDDLDDYKLKPGMNALHT